jgi:hypothetical protein
MPNPVPPTSRPKQIVFVWVDNSRQSQLAEAFARVFDAGHVEASSPEKAPAPEQAQEVQRGQQLPHRTKQ